MKVRFAATLLSAALVGFTGNALAESPAQDARTLLAAGNPTDALLILDQALVKSPKDAGMRFQRGIALSKLGRGPEAIRAFVDLIRDNPQIIEAYNNLAVLYAQQGDYVRARDALEAALAKSPKYAAAQTNLGDIYMSLASIAYGRALELKRDNASVKAKQEGLIRLMSGDGSSQRPPQGVVATPVATTATADASKSIAVSPTASALTPAVAMAAPIAGTTAADASPEFQQQLMTVLNGWLSAWSALDIDKYLAFYAPDFKPEGSIAHGVWAEGRRKRFTTDKNIKVTAQNARFALVDASHASLNFEQNKSTSGVQHKSSKFLDLQKNESGWQIVREYTQ